MSVRWVSVPGRAPHPQASHVSEEKKWGGEMAPRLKQVPHKSEDPSSDPQNPHKWQVPGGHEGTPVKAKTGSPEQADWTD